MRILVVQLKRIGDVVLTTPLIAALRTHAPGSTITLAIDASTAALASSLDADRTLVFRRGPAGLGFWREVVRGGFDVCLDVTGNDRSAMVTALSRAPRRITWARFSEKPLRQTIYTEFVESSVKERHTVDHHTDLLRALGIEVENVPLHLCLSQANREEAAKALATAGISGSFAVVHPGTARSEKYWLTERWVEVIAHLGEERGLPVVLTGSSEATERAHLDALQKMLPKPCVDLAGKLSLPGTAALMEKAKLLCAVDSAPVHLADAVGTPLVALFGPTNPFHWRPRRASSQIVTAAGEWRPTSQFPSKAPMSEISVRHVIDALRRLP